MKLYLIALILAVALTLLTGALETGLRAVPRCPEDAVLVGAGQFESGYWDSYECGPAYDDYLP
ncbi:MAG: hypothetical protein KAR42_14080 [candidate division Zixibacteria bacterium]|nr:hypothetical protein [candidate division Zixibacteria bacterium]